MKRNLYPGCRTDDTVRGFGNPWRVFAFVFESDWQKKDFAIFSANCGVFPIVDIKGPFRQEAFVRRNVRT